MCTDDGKREGKACQKVLICGFSQYNAYSCLFEAVWIFLFLDLEEKNSASFLDLK